MWNSHGVSFWREVQTKAWKCTICCILNAGKNILMIILVHTHDLITPAFNRKFTQSLFKSHASISYFISMRAFFWWWTERYWSLNCQYYSSLIKFSSSLNPDLLSVHKKCLLWGSTWTSRAAVSDFIRNCDWSIEKPQNRHAPSGPQCNQVWKWGLFTFDIRVDQATLSIQINGESTLHAKFNWFPVFYGRDKEKQGFLSTVGVIISAVINLHRWNMSCLPFWVCLSLSGKLGKEYIIPSEWYASFYTVFSIVIF